MNLGATSASLDKIIAGGFTFLATINFNSPLASGDVIRVAAVGTTISVYQNRGLCSPQATDSAIASGFPGIQGKVPTALTNGIIDNWAGGFWATVVSDPTFSPVNGHYTFPQTVTISSTTPTATIFYTTDGTTPTHSSASIASGGTVVINAPATIKAFAAVTGITDSNIVSAPYVALFNTWVPQDLITGLPDRNPGNANVRYEANPQILSANPDGKIFKLWYMGDTGAMSYAESSNGKAWTAYGRNPVIVGGGGDGFPRVYKNGATYWASITSGTLGIDIYTSSNGVAWTRKQAAALVPSQSWEGSKIWQLNVVTVDGNGTWYGYYTGGDTGVFATSWWMGLATSTEGIHWTKSPNNPIIKEYTSNFTWAQSGSFYGWSSDGFTPTGAASVFRFASSNPAGPWARTTVPTYYSTLANEYVGKASGNVVDPSILEVTTAAVRGMYLYGTKTLSGIKHGIICAIAPNVTLAQLVAGNEGVQNVPFAFSDLNLNHRATDTFVRANANPIGGNWSPRVAGNTAQIASNVVEGSVAGTVADSYWNALTWDNDQWARITVGALSANSIIGVSLRQNTSGINTGYRFVFLGATGSTGTWFIQKFVNGKQTNLQSGSLPTGLNVGDTLQGAVIGNKLWMYWNGFILNTAPLTDSSIVSGSGGFAIQPITSVANAQITSFVGGNFQDAGLIPVPTVSVSASDGPMESF